MNQIKIDGDDAAVLDLAAAIKHPQNAGWIGFISDEVVDREAGYTSVMITHETNWKAGFAGVGLLSSIHKNVIVTLAMTSPAEGYGEVQVWQAGHKVCELVMPENEVLAMAGPDRDPSAVCDALLDSVQDLIEQQIDPAPVSMSMLA